MMCWIGYLWIAILVAGCCLMLTFPIAGLLDWFDSIKAKRQRMEKKIEDNRYIRR